MLFIFYVVLLVSSASCAELARDQHPDVGLTTVNMIKRQEYPVEEHVNIQTSDGYLLNLHRIPYGKSNSNQTNKPSIFLMHGLLSSSADWVNMGSRKSIAYQLADAGYDVWLGNSRGNKWSRKHIIYNPDKDFEFWNYSWHEIGTIDLPTMIDYVLSVTGEKKLYYIGHSQGTTSFFVMASEKPEYNDKIKLMVAFAPVVYMSHLPNPFLQKLSKFHFTVGWILSFLGINEFFPSTGLVELIGQAACSKASLFQGICTSVYFLIGGWNSAQLNETMIPVILTNAPAGSSTRQLLHYGQEIQSGKFRQYDYGYVSNLITYGSFNPPDYDLNRVSAPIALIYSTNDWLSAVVDVNLLESELPNVVTSYLVPDHKFNHLDYLFAIDSRKLLYNRVLTILEKY